MDAKRYRLALAFWTSALQYLHLVENVARETVSQGNAWVLIRDFDGVAISAEEYEEGTRWNDRAIIIPLVFNLLHGIELLAKGFLLADPRESLKKSHKLPSLVARVAAKFPEETVVVGLLQKYTDKNEMPTLLARFLDDNSLSVDGAYQAFRYPSPDFVDIRTYTGLKYQGEAGTPFFSDLVEDMRALRIAAVDLGRRIEAGSSPG